MMSYKQDRLLVAIPMKDPARAKTRLGVALTASQRAGLAIALFLNVVKCVRRTRKHVGHRKIDVAVISSSATYRDLAKSYHLKWIDDEGALSLSAAVEHAAKMAHDEGYGSLCILPGDLADPSISDLVQLLNHAVGDANGVICPSGDFGTNALMVPLPSAISFRYGERSFHHHYRSIMDAGLLPVVLPLTSLRRDVDTVKDLDDLERRRPDVVFWRDRG